MMIMLIFVLTSFLVSTPGLTQPIFDECKFIDSVMSKLGKRMSINRQIVARYGGSDKGIEASKALKKQTDDYRQAKKQYKKAGCVNRWSRD